MKAKYKVGDKVWYKDFVGLSQGVITEIHEETGFYVIQNCDNKNCNMHCGYKEVVGKSITNRQYLDSLTDEEFAKQALKDKVYDKDKYAFKGDHSRCISDENREYKKRCEKFNGDCVACRVAWLQEEYKGE